MVNAQEHKITEESLVLLKRDYYPEGKNKFSQKWSGPFRVLKIKRPNAIIRKLDNADPDPITVHLDKLKPFTVECPLPLHSGDELMPPRNLGDPNLEAEAE